MAVESLQIIKGPFMAGQIIISEIIKDPYVSGHTRREECWCNLFLCMRTSYLQGVIYGVIILKYPEKLVNASFECATTRCIPISM